MKRVAVGIPTFNNAAGFISLIYGLREQRGVSIDLIVIANSAEAREYVQAQSQSPAGRGMAGFAVELPDRNLGVAASWNRCASRAFASGYDRIILLNDDLFLLSYDMLAALAERLLDPNSLFLSEHRFSCFVLGRVAFQKVGPFDERFWPAYYEDIDYVRRCRLAGVPLFKSPTPVGVVHRSRSSSRDLEFANLLAHAVWMNRKYYVRKWGGDQGSETYSLPFNGEAEG